MMYLQKVIRKTRRNFFVVDFLKITDEKSRIQTESVSQRYGFDDPATYPKCQGSGTLTIRDVDIVPVPCGNGRRAPCPGFPGYHLRTPHLVTPINITDDSSDPDPTFHVISEPSPDPGPRPKLRPS